MAPIRRTRKLLYALATTVLFFAVLELLLSWFGAETIADREDPFVGFDSVSLFVQDPSGAEWSTRDSKLAWFNQQSFANPKPAGGLRVFCLGGSTTYGRPFDDSLSYCGQLRHLLQFEKGLRHVEVINAGGVSYASYRLARILDEVKQLQPDIVVLYTGHNEYLEQRTYAPLEKMPTWQRESVSWLGQTRTYSLLHELLQPAPSPVQLHNEVKAVLDGAHGPDAYHRDDVMRAQVVAHFRWNLRRMADAATEAGARLVLITPTANLSSMSPFKSETETLPNVEAQAICDKAREALALNDPQSAARSLDQFLQREPRYADAWHIAGRAALMTDQPSDAEACFHQALEEDVCALRANASILDAVRDIAHEKRVTLLDWQRWIREDCLERHGHGCPGSDYFVDHVHPTTEMHSRLALELAKVLQPHIAGMQPLDERIAMKRLSGYREVHWTAAKRGASELQRLLTGA